LYFFLFQKKIFLIYNNLKMKKINPYIIYLSVIIFILLAGIIVSFVFLSKSNSTSQSSESFYDNPYLFPYWWYDDYSPDVSPPHYWGGSWWDGYRRRGKRGLQNRNSHGGVGRGGRHR
jgi:hypothetical protein